MTFVPKFLRPSTVRKAIKARLVGSSQKFLFLCFPDGSTKLYPATIYNLNILESYSDLQVYEFYKVSDGRYLKKIIR